MSRRSLQGIARKAQTIPEPVAQTQFRLSLCPVCNSHTLFMQPPTTSCRLLIRRQTDPSDRVLISDASPGQRRRVRTGIRCCMYTHLHCSRYTHPCQERNACFEGMNSTQIYGYGIQVPLASVLGEVLARSNITSCYTCNIKEL